MVRNIAALSSLTVREAVGLRDSWYKWTLPRFPWAPSDGPQVWAQNRNRSQPEKQHCPLTSERTCESPNYTTPLHTDFRTFALMSEGKCDSLLTKWHLYTLTSGHTYALCKTEFYYSQLRLSSHWPPGNSDRMTIRNSKHRVNVTDLSVDRDEHTWK